MKREDINYVNSWNKSFKNKATMIECVKAVIEGIWISNARFGDVEDIILERNVRIVSNTSGNGTLEWMKDWGFDPIILQIERYDTKTKTSKWIPLYIKGKDNHWSFDLYALRKSITQQGLKLAKDYNISEKEIKDLFNKYHYNDKEAYKELMANRPDLYQNIRSIKKRYPSLHEIDYQTIRAAYCPCLDPLYNWTTDLDKAGITKKQQEEFAYEKMKQYIK